VTPEEARALAAKANKCDERKVAMVVDLWEQAIKKAAQEGRFAVRESALGIVRTPIPSKAYELALAELKARGFRVNN
jgi:hypothetical protein